MAADTDHHEWAPEAAGLLAITLGLGHNYAVDKELLKIGLTIYDALYSYCKHHFNETHDWQPASML